MDGAAEPRQNKRVTITDVARHAGVSIAAVSKVLNNAYGVSPAMHEKVQAAITALDYRPHAAARGMRGRTYTIGVLLDNVRNAFFADILDGIRDELRSSDYTVLIGAAGFDAQDQARTIRSMVDRQMDGLILIAPSTPRPEVLATAASTPTVVIGHDDAADSHDSVVDADDVGATWWWTTWSPSATATSPLSRRLEPGRAGGREHPRSCLPPATWRPCNGTASLTTPRCTMARTPTRVVSKPV